MQEFIKKIFSKKYLLLWIFAIVQVVYHILMREPQGSDAMWFFSKQLDTYTLKDYLEMRYETWASRMFIEAVLVYISRNILLWKIIDWAFWVFLAWALIRLFPEDKRESAGWMVVGILLVYPIWDLRTAGWIATSVNYTWTLALGAFALHGVADTYYQCVWKSGDKKRISPIMYIIYAIAALYSANMEQMSAVLLAVSGCSILYFISQKIPVKQYISSIICCVISVAEFVFILICPGNAARKSQEIINWMPNFESYSLLDKINMGFMDTMQHLLSSGNLMFLAFALVLAILVFLKTKDTVFRFTAVFPVALNILLVFFRDTLEAYLPTFSKLMEKSAFITGKNYHLAANYLPMILYLAVIGCVLISLVVVCESWFELAGQSLLLALALATRVIMGFTPTIYISQERTFLYLYILLGVSGIWLVLQNKELLDEGKCYRGLKTAGACLMVFGVILALAEIGSIQ